MRLLLRFFADLEVHGLENLPTHGPVIFAANHESELDVILVPASLPFISLLAPMFYVAKKREFYRKTGLRSLFYGGFFFKLWGAYPVREGLRNYKFSLNMHLRMLHERKCVLIFPEGRVTPDGRIGKAHGGVAYLAWESRAPVVPVGIKSTYQISFAKLLARRQKITITFGSPKRYPDGETSKPPIAELRGFADGIMNDVRGIISHHA